MPIVIKMGEETWFPIDPQGSTPLLFLDDYNFRRLNDGEITLDELDCSSFMLQDALCDFLIEDPEFPDMEELPEEDDLEEPNEEE